MTTPDELERAVKALTDMRDAARDGTPVTDPNEWEFDELTRILAAFHFLLSERAELLAAVERMREIMSRLVALPVAETEFGYLDKGIGTKTQNGVWLEARAAVTTGEGK